MDDKKNFVLVTGASSGIGRAFAEIFAQHHDNLILVARNQDALEELATKLQQKHGIQTHVIVSDLAKPNAAQNLFAEITRRKLHVDTLINNAGFGYKEAFASMDPKIIHDMLQVNMVALTELTRLLIPAMQKQGFGRILNICSTSAFQPGPLMATYFASKAYVLSFSQALAKELHSSGITVTTICPGPTLTKFAKRAHLEDNPIHSGFPPGYSAEYVAKKGYAMLQKGKRFGIIGFINRTLSYISMIMPTRWVMYSVYKIHSKSLTRKIPVPIKNTKTRYGTLSRLLHWGVFLLVFGLIIIGFFMGDIGNKAVRGDVYTIHKFIGLSILTLMVFRLLWASLNPKPDMPKGTPTWERRAAHAGHYLLYAVVISMPLSGWIMASAANKAPKLFGASLAFPGIPLSKPLAHNAANIHFILAWTIIALVCLHALAALKHHFINKDDVLKRML